MGDYTHTVLCVDDEQGILQSLKRLLRKEDYSVLTASSGAEGLRILEANDVHLVISDHRMPRMSGTEFFAAVKELYPDTFRIILSGYTDVDSITESVNKGHVYKFFLKPWNDQSLKLEIKQALHQYDLIQANKRLHEKVLDQNEELRKTNENLEMLVKERTMELEMQNQALELSQAILEDLPLPIIGADAQGLIVVINKAAKSLSLDGKEIELGREVDDYFPADVKEKIACALETNRAKTVQNWKGAHSTYDVTVTPLTERFERKGAILSLKSLFNQ